MAQAAAWRDGDGFEALQRVMWGYAKHPNHAGVLMVGLGLRDEPDRLAA